MHSTNVTDEEPWIIVNQDDQHSIGLIRFQRAVKRVCKLLRLRIIWSRSGSWLNTSYAKQSHNAHIKSVMTHIFASWPRTVLSKTKPLFSHVKREKGKLVYK